MTLLTQYAIWYQYTHGKWTTIETHYTTDEAKKSLAQWGGLPDYKIAKVTFEDFEEDKMTSAEMEREVFEDQLARLKRAEAFMDLLTDFIDARTRDYGDKAERKARQNLIVHLAGRIFVER